LNPETKRFLLLLTGVAMAGWIAANWLLGPPGHSRAYLDAHGAAHDRYLETVKSDDYKRYIQRPHLVDLDEQPNLQARIEHVAAYTNSEAFQAERHRIHLYGLFFEIFNAAIVVILVVRLAKPPLLKFLDGQIEELREKINQAARSRKSALGRRTAIAEKLANVHEDELKLQADTEARLERQMAELAEANHYSLSLHQRELIERKKAEVHGARIAMKRKIIDAAVASLVGQTRAHQTPEGHDALVRQFAADVEARS